MQISEKVARLKSDFDGVYKSGIENSENYKSGYADGKQAEYDAFWDTYQKSGERTNYAHAFSGVGWNGETFKPKYDITPSDGYMMFRYFDYAGDMVELLNNLGITLDTSKCTNINYMFFGVSCTRLGVLDFSKSITTGDNLAWCPNLKTIDKIIVGAKTVFTNATFQGDTNLEDIIFDGTIAQSGLNLQWSTKLSRASIESVIGHLDDTYNRPASSITLSLAAVNKAFESGEGNNNGADTDEFNNLCAGARAANWTISLV